MDPDGVVVAAIWDRYVKCQKSVAVGFHSLLIQNFEDAIGQQGVASLPYNDGRLVRIISETNVLSSFAGRVRHEFSVTLGTAGEAFAVFGFAYGTKHRVPVEIGVGARRVPLQPRCFRG